MVSNKKRKNNRNNKRSNIKNTNEGTNEAQHEEHDDGETEAHVGDTQNDTIQRSYPESDSDIEGEPRKKKKKKQPLPTATDKKGKKSIRQMKKEKFIQRQAEAQAVAKDQLKAQCLSYLSQWKDDRDNWKFMKIKQMWLYKNKFSSNLIPDLSWPVLLEYFESAKGNIRNMLLDDANKIIKQMDNWTESQNKEQDGENKEDSDSPADMQKPDETSYKRARDLIQCLEE